MIDGEWSVLLFIKDFTGRGADKFYWAREAVLETTPKEVVSYNGTVVCHDFWIIRDVIYDQTGDLPQSVIDLDEFRMAISGNPADRMAREKIDITSELAKFGASAEVCSTYQKMFNRGINFEPSVAQQAAEALRTMFLSLCKQAKTDGEWERFTSVEVPVYRVLQKAMSAGVSIDSTDLSKKDEKRTSIISSH